ncbi:hypothetical protein X756_22675 [Mesorhizobium sp. LSHC412B00]|nr:hypothetical protein X756_22675 [Mesorhizobium sp. LSHC412B00]
MEFHLPEAFNHVVLSRVLRASLAHQRAQMLASLAELARVRTEIREAAAIRAHLRACATQPWGEWWQTASFFAASDPLR